MTTIRACCHLQAAGLALSLALGACAQAPSTSVPSTPAPSTPAPPGQGSADADPVVRAPEAVASHAVGFDPAFPADWLTCRAMEDCTSVDLSCRGRVAVRVDRAGDLQRHHLERNGVWLQSADCAGPQPSVPVACLSAQCTIVKAPPDPGPTS